MGKTKKQEIVSFLEKTKVLVDPKIKELLNIYVSKRFEKLTNYQIGTGGKRLRACLTLLSCLACGGKIKNAIYPAAGIEILHNNTLIIDDIIDHGSWRRNRKTCWKKFGASITECISFIYSAAVFQAAFFSKKPKLVSDRLARAMKTVLQGEILDILFEQSGREEENYVQKNRYHEVNLYNYLEMVSKKTAALIQAAVEIGGICAGARKKQIEALENYGLNLGIAFQIKDDILDIYGEEKKFGKKIGQDIRERKLGSILIFYALKETSEQDGKKLLKILKKKKITEKDVKSAIKVIKQTSAQEKAMKLGKEYILKAKQSLKILPQNKWTKLLRNIADFAIEREK